MENEKIFMQRCSWFLTSKYKEVSRTDTSFPLRTSLLKARALMEVVAHLIYWMYRQWIMLQVTTVVFLVISARLPGMRLGTNRSKVIDHRVTKKEGSVLAKRCESESHGFES